MAFRSPSPQLLNGFRENPWNDAYCVAPGRMQSRIWFEIVSVSGLSAQVTVKGAELRHLVGRTLTVLDESECYFTDETPAALVGRYGWATRMHTDSDIYLHYVVDGLCCP